jgi:hypothetical protein
MKPRIYCVRCRYTGSAEQFPVNNEQWTCPVCLMDESGLEVRWDSRELADLRTNPDLQELADDIAEKFRIALYEGDEDVEDRVIDLAADFYPDGVIEELEIEEDSKLLIAAEEKVWDVLRHILIPRVIRVIKKGDWRVDEASEGE